MGPNSSHFGYYGQQKPKPPIKMIALIVGVFIFLIIAIIVMQSIIKGGSIDTQAQHLSPQLTNVAALTVDGTDHLRSEDLKKINAETSIITEGAMSQLVSILPAKPDKTIANSESDASSTAKLASAALDGTYDSEYKLVLTQKLESISALLTEMYTKTKSPSIQESLSSTYKNYQALLNNLGKIKT